MSFHVANILKLNKTKVNYSILNTICGKPSAAAAATATGKNIPKEADVVIIGGGSAGCHSFYHLTKRGAKAVILERAKLTAGTTWHTAGCIWRFRPNDVDVQLLSSSANMLQRLEDESGIYPGWIQNGGIFIAHSKERLDEYRRLSTVGNFLGIENHVLTPKETKEIFPLLNENSFIGALYSPKDGVVDPAMLCSALTKYGIERAGLVIEECPVVDLLVENVNNYKKVTGVRTLYGDIKTSNVLLTTGVWSRDLVEKHGIHLPLIPMRHAYIVSEPIPGVNGMPNVRDHDYSIYFRIQGQSICMGGYENNPSILNERVPNNFNFSLYDLDWTCFEEHMKGTIDLCPAFGRHGIKSTVCGPESFTPDHKPLMGPEPDIHGLYYNCGFNSLGMMFGGGCGEQIALWIINGRPDLPMFQFDIRRFTKEQSKDNRWIKEKSHETYAKNYSIVFPNDQRKSGRNFILDPLHEQMIDNGAFMIDKQGWECPAFFLEGRKINIPPYDWYGCYGYKPSTDREYIDLLKGDLKYEFSDYHDVIGKESLACRENVVVFNQSYFCKMYLQGEDANTAAEWIFSGDVNKTVER